MANEKNLGIQSPEIMTTGSVDLQLLPLIMDNIPQAVFWKDRDLVYLGCNRAFAEDVGLESTEQIIGKTDYELPWTEQADLYRTDDQVVIDSGQSKLNYEEPQTTPTGDTIWLRTSKIPVRDSSDEIVAVLGMYEDITERKQVENSLLESEHRFRTLFDDSADAYLIIDGGLFTECNQATVDMLRADTKEEVLSTHPSELSPDLQPDGRFSSEKADEMMQIALDEGSNRFEWIHRRIDGEDFPVEVLLTPITVGEKTIIHTVWRDISDRKRLQQEAEQTFERRGYQVQISTEIAQEISQATELSQLFEDVVTLTKEQLGYYHTQLLRYDPTQDAVVLIAGYGETGRKMFAAGHSMPMGIGLIGTAAATGETVLRPDLAEDPDWRPNPLLPETRGEIAVPIKLGDQIMGVLDVQSDRAGALTDDDRLLLEGLCGQVAIAMDQTRLRQEMEERLQEISSLYRTISRDGWQRYQDSTSLPDGFIFDQSTVRPIEAADEVVEAFSNVPLTLPGGQVIGSLSVEDDPDSPLTEDDLYFLSQVTEQIALALENARLTEQTQDALSETEVLLNTSRTIGEALTIEDLLNGVTQVAPVMGIDSVSLRRVASWDEENQPRTVDLYDMAVEAEQNVFTTFYENTPIPDPASMQSILDAPDQMLLYADAQDENSDIPPRIREDMLKRGIRGSVTTVLLSGDQMLGNLTLNSSQPIYKFPERSVRILKDVLADQVSAFLENMRLMDQAQRKAESESLVNIIGQRIQSTTSVEDALQVAVQELGQALGVKKTRVQIGLPRKADNQS